MTIIPLDRDYNVCPANHSGEHGPVVQHYDPDLPEGYAGVACESCGTTTAIDIPPASDIEWN